MRAILMPDGIMALSWRVENTDRRDERGRLYCAFDRNLVLGALAGATVLLDEELVSPSSGRKIHRLVARRGA